MSDAEKSKLSKEIPTASDASLASPPATTIANDSSSSPTSSTATTTATAVVATTSTSNSGNCTSIIKLPSKPPPPLPPPPPAPAKLLPPAAPVSRQHRIHEPPTESVVKKAFADFMKDPECLDKATDYLYESLLEDAVMGVYLEVQHSVRSGSLEAIEGQSEDDTAFKIVDTPNYDVFGMSTARKDMDCNCPNCDRLVAASRFAPHLEKCMGMGRKTSRKASRRLANAKEGNSSYFYSNASDEDDDADRSSEKRRKKIQTSRTNGSKKNGKSS